MDAASRTCVFLVANVADRAEGCQWYVLTHRSENMFRVPRLSGLCVISVSRSKSLLSRNQKSISNAGVETMDAEEQYVVFSSVFV